MFHSLQDMSDILSVRGDFSAAFQEVRQAKPEDFKAPWQRGTGNKNGESQMKFHRKNIWNTDIEKPEIHET